MYSIVDNPVLVVKTNTGTIDTIKLEKLFDLHTKEEIPFVDGDFEHLYENIYIFDTSKIDLKDTDGNFVPFEALAVINTGNDKLIQKIVIDDKIVNLKKDVTKLVEDLTYIKTIFDKLTVTKNIILSTKLYGNDKKNVVKIDKKLDNVLKIVKQINNTL